MKNNKYTKIIPLSIGVIILSLIIGYVVWAWTEPTAAPPGINRPAPINVGTTTQNKEGIIGAHRLQDFPDTQWFVDPASSLSAAFSGNVGIGTTAPLERLHVEAGRIVIRNNVAGNRLVWQRTDNTQITGFASDGFSELQFLTNNTERMRITAGGNVGIGTIYPLTRLGVVGGLIYTGDHNTRFGAQISGDDGGRGVFGSNLYIGGDGQFRTFGGHTSYGFSGMDASWGALRFYTATGATTQDGIVSPITRMKITTAGDVGIGTTTPTQRLHVEGGGRFTGPVEVAAPTAANHAATRAYVDAAVGAPTSCPVEIETTNRAAALLRDAITTCRNRGGTWRLPTHEELSCFIGVGHAETGWLWTRSPSTTQTNQHIGIWLNSGQWWDFQQHETSVYRCVR